VFRRCRKLALAVAFAAGPAWAQPVTIAALGDSLTQGYGLPADQGFVPRLQAWLDDNGVEAVLVNAGVSGDTTAGGLSRVAWTLTPDVGAMIVALGGNDLLRGIDPATSRANLRGILEAARAAAVPVLLVGLRAPGNYGPEFKEAFDAIYPELADEFDVLHEESFLAPLEAARDAGRPLSELMQPDGIHPSAEGVDMVVEALGPRVLELVEQAQAGG
jgi:acyl-CoA thioesterase I